MASDKEDKRPVRILLRRWNLLRREIHSLSELYKDIVTFQRNLAGEGKDFSTRVFSEKKFEELKSEAKELFKEIKELECIQKFDTKKLIQIRRRIKKYPDLDRMLYEDERLRKIEDIENDKLEEIFEYTLTIFELIHKNPGDQDIPSHESLLALFFQSVEIIKREIEQKKSEFDRVRAEIDKLKG